MTFPLRVFTCSASHQNSWNSAFSFLECKTKQEKYKPRRYVVFIHTVSFIDCREALPLLSAAGHQYILNVLFFVLLLTNTFVQKCKSYNQTIRFSNEEQ